MQENCAALAPDARALIVIRHRHDVIGTILTPKRLVAFGKRQFDRSVIATTRHIITPALVRPQARGIDQGSGPPHAVWSELQADNPETALGTSAIALPL